MGGPTEQKTDTIFIPPGEGRQTFAPSPLGWLVENLVPGQDGILESIVGPAPMRIRTNFFVNGTPGADSWHEEYEVDPFAAPAGGLEGVTEDDIRYSVKNGAPFSIFATRLMQGKIPILLLSNE